MNPGCTNTYVVRLHEHLLGALVVGLGSVQLGSRLLQLKRRLPRLLNLHAQGRLALTSIRA